MALVVIARKAYGKGTGADYPNLAGKVKKPGVRGQGPGVSASSRSGLRLAVRMSRVPVRSFHSQTRGPIVMRNMVMKNARLALLGVLSFVMLLSAAGQQASKHVLSSDELKKAVPAEFFFAGQKATVQLRNAVGFQLADGKMALAALVDASGYSTSIQQKYQGMRSEEHTSELQSRP